MSGRGSEDSDAPKGPPAGGAPTVNGSIEATLTPELLFRMNKKIAQLTKVGGHIKRLLAIKCKGGKETQAGPKGLLLVEMFVFLVQPVSLPPFHSFILPLHRLSAVLQAVMSLLGNKGSCRVPRDIPSLCLVRTPTLSLTEWFPGPSQNCNSFIDM